MVRYNRDEDVDVADANDNFLCRNPSMPFQEQQVHLEMARLRAAGCYKRVASADTVPGHRFVGQGPRRGLLSTRRRISPSIGRAHRLRTLVS
jgi:hypothetical protein